MFKPSGLPFMPATAQTVLQWGCHSHPSWPCCSLSVSALSWPDPLGGYCQPSHSGRQTGNSPCGLPFSFPPTDGSGPNHLLRRGTAGLESRRPQRQTRGLELAA